MERVLVDDQFFVVSPANTHCPSSGSLCLCCRHSHSTEQVEGKQQKTIKSKKNNTRRGNHSQGAGGTLPLHSTSDALYPFH